MRTSEHINEIAPAMALAQGRMKKAMKDTTNPFFKSKYSDLASVWDAASEPLAENGLFASQDLTTVDRGVEITTRITHTSGQWMEFGPFLIPVDDKKAHAYGSAATYGRRYALSAALSIVADDDDGNAAMFINRDQAEIILLYLELCGPDVKTNFMAHINKTYFAKGDVCKIPSSAYQDLKLGLVKKRTRSEQEATATT